MKWPVEPTQFDSNPYDWEWYDRDYLFTPDGTDEYPNHHCKITWADSVSFINSARNAIDIGCRDGEYSRYLHKTFEHVYCFDYRRRKLFHKNVDLKKITHFKCALGDEFKIISASGGGSITSNGVPKEKWYDLQLYTLDQFAIENVDYIKIDVDGYELQVLRGALNTIEKYSPILVIEQEFGEDSSIKFCETKLNYEIANWDRDRRNVIMRKRK
jgi:FkbM family methyltransferase